MIDSRGILDLAFTIISSAIGRDEAVGICTHLGLFIDLSRDLPACKSIYRVASWLTSHLDQKVCLEKRASEEKN